MNYLLIFVIIYLAIFTRNYLSKIFSQNISVKYLIISSLVQVGILGLTIFIIKEFNFSNFLAYTFFGVSLIVTLFVDSKIEKLYLQE
ncbi:hypothetical protein [Paenibacillus sp. P36]|uniref:hypothetical protein n=1 Tax=Paenibacillus sp. P36 TaxID=3342538 RepID=UPI0038B33645